MAQGFPLPPPLSLSQPDLLAAPWKAWRRQWDNYTIATGFGEKSENVQVATLLTCLGPEALNLLDGLCPDEDDQKKVSIVLTKFEEFCVGTKNETFERYKFNSRNQENGEPIEMYVAELRKLAKSCNYRDLEDSLIRDRIVLGVPDVSVRKRLLQELDLDIAKAVSVVKAHEATQKQMQNIDNNMTTDVHAVQKRSNVAGKRASITATGQDKTKPRECKFCGRVHPFKKDSCPAWGKSCQACGRRNHFATKCWYAEVRLTELAAASDIDENLSLQQTESTLTLEIRAVSAQDSGKLFAHLLLGSDHLQRFQLDTGATANIIPQHVYKKASSDQHMRKLKPCDISLVMFNKSTTKVTGKALMEVLNPKNGLRYDVEFLVVREDFIPLIGVKTLQSMNLIEVKSENIASVTDEVEKQDEAAHENEITENRKDIYRKSGKAKAVKNADLQEEDRCTLFNDVFTGEENYPGSFISKLMNQ